MRWTFRPTSSYDPNHFSREVAPLILNIFYEGMGITGWDIDGVNKARNNSDILGMLNDESEVTHGYFFAKIPQNEFQNARVLWVYSCAINRTFHAKGFAQKAVDLCRSQHTNLGWIGGRTQNPIVMRLLDKLGRDGLYPFDCEYSKDIMQFLIAHFNEVREPYENNSLELSTGICRKTYKEGQLGTYPLDLLSARSTQFENILKQWDFNRKAGDAIVLFSALK